MKSHNVASGPEPLHTKSSTATQITPTKSRPDGSHYCIVDHDRKPFSVAWYGSSQCPDLAGFPALRNVEISPVEQSPVQAELWRNSTPLDFGSHASIRITENGNFPVMKLTHSDELSCGLIQHEFKMLTELTSLGMPVPKSDPQPIVDNGVIIGYRMQELFKFDQSKLDYRGRRKLLLHRFQLWRVDYVHGDMKASNIMQDIEGNFVFIDFSFTGKLDDIIPPCIPSWIYEDDRFTINPDFKVWSEPPYLP